jgi:hypothetical protein
VKGIQKADPAECGEVEATPLNIFEFILNRETLGRVSEAGMVKRQKDRQAEQE